MLNVGNKRKSMDSSHAKERGIYNSISLSLYNNPPMQEVSLDEFEEMAIDRLRVLKTIEMYRAKGPQHYKSLVPKVDKVINSNLPLRKSSSSEPKRDQQDKMKDVLSHFILRMAFCQNEDLRRWFLTNESHLFRYRLDKYNKEEKMAFMRRNGFDYDQATKEEVENKRMKLKAARDAFLFDQKEKLSSLGVYFKIPFTEALELIGHRKVLLENGIAYVPMEHLVSIIFARFRANMSRQLAIAYKKLPRAPVSRDERLIPVLKNLAKHYIGPDYSSTVAVNSNQITPNMIDDLSKQSMPLCMRSLHGALRSEHHLKHGGRMQYGLFLKGIGLQMEDALAFWRQEFCKKMNVDDFNKRYSYNIRHNYGKEGKRKDYTPYNCAKIIMGEPPKNGEHHGCPFRHFDESSLRGALRGIDEVSKGNIVQLAKGKHYQPACKAYFEATHKGANADVVGSHPNQYFEESQKFLKEAQAISA